MTVLGLVVLVAEPSAGASPQPTPEPSSPVVEFAVVSECDGAGFVDAVVADSEVGVGAVVFRTDFGETGVGDA